MRKLVALLFALTLLAPALALAQDQPGTPVPGSSSGQPAQVDFAQTMPEALQRAVDDVNAKRREQAVMESSLFILMNPTYAHGYFIRAVAYAGLNKLPEALDDLNKALSLAQGFPAEQFIIYDRRARVYIGMNQLPEAVSDLTSAILISPNADLYGLRALILMQQLEYASAIKDLNEAIQLTPTNNNLYLLRAGAYAAAGNKTEAARDYLAWIFAPKPQQISDDPIDAGTNLRLNMTADKVYIVPVNLKKGQSVSIAAVKQAGNIDPLIVLVDPAQEPLIANDDVSPGSQNSMISNFAVPADGIYLLIVSHAGGGTDGDVVVQIRAQ